jgi:molybdopterin converting factor small subunit
MPTIRLTTLFAERIGGLTSVEVPAVTVEAALRALTDRHPQLASLVWKGGHTINPVMVVFLNDRQLGPDELGAAVMPADQIDIVPAIEGG